MDKKELKKQGQALKPFLNIGKHGVSDDVLDNISKYLKAHKLGKIKFLDASLDDVDSKKEFAQSIATKTKSEIIQQIGNVVVLWKR